ncbi:hypothetical protein ACFOY2_36130 [Nonomuraea purpurea]|uniref:MFS transporter n=1 Tax=Nonomuraea purpurea TaxID=1849276 RepID=A0ABV8GFJ2_9ACTN
MRAWLTPKVSASSAWVTPVPAALYPANQRTACLADVVPAASRGLGFAVLQLLTTGGGAFGSLVVGVASDRFGSLLAGMYILVPPMIVGGLLTLRARTSFERDAREVMREAAGG